MDFNQMMNNHHRFDNIFQSLNKLVCNFADSFEFIDRLANLCKNIQSLEIQYSSYDAKFDCSLNQLIKAQNQIKKLIINSYYTNQGFSNNFNTAISEHSQSIVYYKSFGENNIDHILLPAFKNLKTLSLYDKQLKHFKNISLENIESMKLKIRYRPFLLDLLSFINTNGKTLKDIDLDGVPNDSEFLGKLFQSIAQHCKILEDLSTFYKNEFDQELMEIFNNCFKLENIRIKPLHKIEDRLDGDKIFSVLNQTLPKKLKSISLPHGTISINDDSFDNLMKNWKGPKSFTVKYFF
jgi:hypothetical protein